MSLVGVVLQFDIESFSCYYMQSCAYSDIINLGNKMREITKAFKALSDETRLRILNLLLERECCVCEVMQVLDISQTRASRNLTILYEAGFLKLRREGLWALYSIDESCLKNYHQDLIEATRQGLAKNKIALRDRQKLKTAERIGPVCAARN